MPPTLYDILAQLQQQAQPRPDLITPGSTGQLENARPVTYMGRMVMPGESAEQVRQRMPIGEMESGGQAMGSLPIQAIVAPTANPILQGIYKDIQKRVPDLWQAAERDKRMLYGYYVPDITNTKGTVGTYRSINPLASEVMISAKQPVRELLPTGIHEFQHFLTEPLLAAVSPAHALETTAQIARLLPASRQAIVKNFLPNPNQMEAVLKQLSASRFVNVPPLSFAEAPADFARRGLSEALSYMAETALKPGYGDPMLPNIAEALLKKYR